MSTHKASRRVFLQHASALSAMGTAAGPLALNLAAMGNAAAQSATDYKALVCIFLYGGNDSIHMVLPTDTASWGNYTTLRSQAPDSIALMPVGTAPVAGAGLTTPARLGGVLPITPTDAQGRSFALHPLMGTLQTMFNTERRLAILPNVGPLVMPTTKAQYSLGSHPKPRNLFSHNDQQNMWQAFAPEGATVGWGGRLGDLFASSNGGRAVFTAISTSGNNVWLSGQSVRQYQVGTNGAIRMGTSGATNTLYGSTAVGAAMRNIVSATRGGHPMERDIADTNARSVVAEETLRAALPAASDPLFGTAPASGAYNANNDPKLRNPDPTSAVAGATTFNGLAQQLQTVARLIQASGPLGIRRQVFFVSLGGFDSHDAQNRSYAQHYARLAHAMRYFDTALIAMGASNKVTTFTASDFGRTFTSNGDGTDHGWGAHHFVSGGAVDGGKLFGTFPVLGAKNANNNGFDSSPDQIGNGAFIPTTSVDQFAGTLAKWFGVSDSEALALCPNLSNFSNRDLGFLRAT